MKQRETKKQLTLNFDGGLVDSYSSCREFIAARIHQQGRPQKSIAADMDLSPSQLSRKAAQNPDDTMRFTLDDMERFIQVTGDRQPVIYLVEKYLSDRVGEIEMLERRLAELRASA